MVMLFIFISLVFGPPYVLSMIEFDVYVVPDISSTLYIRMEHNVYTLNPLWGLHEGLDILNLIFEPLTLPHPFNPFDLSGRIPWLLETLPEYNVHYNETLEINVTICTLRLRKGILFFDGTEMTSKDLAFTFEFICWVMPPTLLPLAGRIIDISIVDNYTVSLVINGTGIGITYGISTMIVLPRHIYGKAETWGCIQGGTFPEWNVTPEIILSYNPKGPDDPILTGYGPFRLTRWEPRGNCTSAHTFELIRNDLYFMSALDEEGNIIWEWKELTLEDVELLGADALRGPYIAKVVFRVINDDLETIDGLLSGDLDMAIVGPWKYYCPDPLVTCGFRIILESEYAYSLLFINTREKHLNNPEFRRAIAYAIDKKAICQSIYAGYAQPVDAAVPEAMKNWSIEYTGFKKFSYSTRDLQKALLELATINITNRDDDPWLEESDGSEIYITIHTYNNTDALGISNMLASFLEEAGIHTSIDIIDPIRYLYDLHYSPLQILLGKISFSMPVPFFLEFFSSQSVFQLFTGWRNESYEELVARAFYYEDNISNIMKYVWEAQDILLEEQPFIPLCIRYIRGAYKSYETFGTEGLMGVFEEYPGLPVVNRWTLLKASRPIVVYTTGQGGEEKNEEAEQKSNFIINLAGVDRTLILWLLVNLLVIVLILVAIRRKKKRESMYTVSPYRLGVL